jgi:hypothetical protein
LISDIFQSIFASETLKTSNMNTENLKNNPQVDDSKKEQSSKVKNAATRAAEMMGAAGFGAAGAMAANATTVSDEEEISEPQATSNETVEVPVVEPEPFDPNEIKINPDEIVAVTEEVTPDVEVEVEPVTIDTDIEPDNVDVVEVMYGGPEEAPEEVEDLICGLPYGEDPSIEADPTDEYIAGADLPPADDANDFLNDILA